MHKLTFEFQTDSGHVAQVAVKTHETRYLEDDTLETLVYDPTRPTYGTTIDQLPGWPQIDEDGSISVRHAYSVCWELVLPALTIIGHGTYVLMRYVW